MSIYDQFPEHCRGRRCGPHTHGVGPEMPAFFYDWCVVCQAKKSAGLVTGKEGYFARGDGFYQRKAEAYRKRAEFVRTKRSGGPKKRRLNVIAGAMRARELAE